ncbi:ribonuclease H-like domain-containing protein [Tanacetum coccineum]
MFVNLLEIIIVQFDAFGFSVKDFLTRYILYRCDSSRDLYPVTQPSPIPHALLSVSHTTWHQCLRHPDDEVIRSLVSCRYISCNKEKSLHVCHACQLGKHVRLLFSSSNSIVTHCFEIVHSDIWTSLICDHGGEFDNTNLLDLFAKNGIQMLYKARLVANSSTQQLGVDCDDTFSSVFKAATIRTVLSLALSRNWPIHQLDVKNAFLNGDLSKTVYMYQPPGYVDVHFPHHVYRLRRCGTEVSYLLIYVDDIVLTAFSTDLLHQYALKLLNMAHMATCNPTRTPVDTKSKIGSNRDLVFYPTLYRSLAGGLQYLTFTRPNISYAIQHVCLHMHDPREPYFLALKPVLCYVRGTLDFGLQLYASSTHSLVAYPDADWVGCPTTMRSTSGYCVILRDNLISWSSKRQHTLFRSSVEAEYY